MGSTINLGTGLCKLLYDFNSKEASKQTARDKRVENEREDTSTKTKKHSMSRYCLS